MSAIQIPYGELSRWRSKFGGVLAVTNGCFDIIHAGHVECLRDSKGAAFLLVGINGDESVRQLKGEGRPVHTAEHRAKVVAAIRYVDAVCIFPEVRAENFLRMARPNFYTKGGDYTLDSLDHGERRALEACGALIRLSKAIPGLSTTQTLLKAETWTVPSEVSVNGKPYKFSSPTVTLAQLVNATGREYRQTELWAATYFKGPDSQREGTVKPGDAVPVRPGMCFTVVQAERA